MTIEQPSHILTVPALVIFISSAGLCENCYHHDMSGPSPGVPGPVLIKRQVPLVFRLRLTPLVSFINPTGLPAAYCPSCLDNLSHACRNIVHTNVSTSWPLPGHSHYVNVWLQPREVSPAWTAPSTSSSSSCWWWLPGARGDPRSEVMQTMSRRDRPATGLSWEKWQFINNSITLI